MRKKSLFISLVLLFTFIIGLAFSLKVEADEGDAYNETIDVIDGVTNVTREYIDYSNVELNKISENDNICHVEFCISYPYIIAEELKSIPGFSYDNLSAELYMDYPGDWHSLITSITIDEADYEYDEGGNLVPEVYRIENMEEDLFLTFANVVVCDSFFLTEDKAFNSHLSFEFDINDGENDYHYNILYYSEELKLEYNSLNQKIEYNEIETEDKYTRIYHLPSSVMHLDKKMVPPYSYQVGLSIGDLGWFYEELNTIDGFDLAGSCFSVFKDFYGTSSFVDVVCWPDNYEELYNGIKYTDDVRESGLGNMHIATFNNVSESFDLSAHIKCELGVSSSSKYIDKTVEVILYLDDLHINPIKPEELISLDGTYYIDTTDDDNKEYRANFTSYINYDLLKKLKNDGSFTDDAIASTELIANDSVSFGELIYSLDRYYDYENNYVEEVVAHFELENLPSEPISFSVVLSYYSNGEKYVFKSNTVTLIPLELSILVDDLSTRDEVPVNGNNKLSVALNSNYQKESSHVFFSIYSSTIDFDFSDALTFDEEANEWYLNCPTEAKLVLLAGFEGYINEHMRVICITAKKTIIVKNEVIEYVDINELVDVKYANADSPLMEQIDIETSYIAKGNNELLDISLNETNHLVLGGRDILLYVNIPDEYLADDLVYSFSLANENINTISLKSNKNIVIISTNSVGRQKVIITVKGNTVGLVRKEIIFEVIDLATASIKISYDNSLYHQSEENIQFSISINGITDFLNLDVVWSATNKDGECDNLEVEGGNMILLSPAENDYYINATIDSEFMLDAIDSKTNKVKVRSNIPADIDLNEVVKVSYVNSDSDLLQSINPEYAKKYVVYTGSDLSNIKLSGVNNMILGGKDILLYIDIPNEYLDDDLDYVWSLGNEGINSIKLSSNKNVALIKAQASGKQKVIFKLQIDSEEIYKEIYFDIIDLDTADVQIVYEDSYHKSFNDIDFNVFINGSSDFVNLDVVWNVTNTNGDYDQILVDGSKMTLLAPPESDYVINASIVTNLSYDACKLTTNAVKVRNINMDSLVRTLLPISAVVLVLLVALFIFLRKYWDRIFNLTKRLNNALAKLEAIDVESDSFIKDSKKLLSALKSCLDKEESLNVDRLGQFDSFINTTKTGINIVKSMIKNDDKLNYEKRKSCIDMVRTQYILKLLKLTSDYEEAEKKFAAATAKGSKSAITYNPKK